MLCLVSGGRRNTPTVVTGTCYHILRSMYMRYVYIAQCVLHVYACTCSHAHTSLTAWG
jgi:hypothetical protein